VADFGSVISPDEIGPRRMLDTPLGELAVDAETQRMVDRILSSTEESSRSPVMPFNSGF
jgi:hypothetical protein